MTSGAALPRDLRHPDLASVGLPFDAIVALISKGSYTRVVFDSGLRATVRKDWSICLAETKKELPGVTFVRLTTPSRTALFVRKDSVGELSTEKTFCLLLSREGRVISMVRETRRFVSDQLNNQPK